MKSRAVLRWALLSVLCGVGAGLTSFVFLVGLDLVTKTRLSHSWLVWLLPVGAGLTGLAYHHLGGNSAKGNALIFDHMRSPTGDLPLRMAPLVLVGSWVTHLFGGSAGREGVAMQLASVASDGLARVMKLSVVERQRLLICAFAGAFGAAFGVPLGGALFALEVQAFPNGKQVRRWAAVPVLASALVGDRVVRLLGYDHHPPTLLRLNAVSTYTITTFVKIAACGVLFGLVAKVFSTAVFHLKHELNARITFPPFRQVLGGAAVVAISMVVGTRALGLSSPLLADALAGRSVGSWIWAAKLVLTVLTVGAALPGGEVTPLFVIGATLGAATADPLHLPVALVASVGFVAVFAGAANTPLACVVIGAELLGWPVVPFLVVGCGVAYLVSGRRGIYPATRRHRYKLPIERWVSAVWPRATRPLT